MRVGVVGINHKLAELKLRELLAKACQRRFSNDGSLHGVHSFILLSTCNRTEIYFASDDLPQTHTYILSILRNEVEQEFDQKLYSYFGLDCFQHLCRVTAGLDSAIVAETEIQGQVKSAYENASSCHFIPSELHYLFQKSLRIGKQVRAELPSTPGLPNLEHAIYSAGTDLFQNCRNPRILFIGASDINVKVLSFLKSRHYRHITLCNRTWEHALPVQKMHGIELLHWSQKHAWTEFDWMIFGTKAPEFLLKKEDLNLENTPKKLLIDLCVPRNVDPLLSHGFSGITLLNIDQLNRTLKKRRSSLTDALLKAESTIHTLALYHIRQFKMRESYANRLAVV